MATITPSDQRTDTVPVPPAPPYLLHAQGALLRMLAASSAAVAERKGWS